VQVLRGLGDDLAQAVAAAGLRARVYCPVGELVAGMAYLVRRLLENTANESFLAERAAGTSLEQLLAAP
jgi:RHH-type proline utilization regulon transcriptional repressor/proline dehydrogenase/delta 1-pyrroline-5-carboxylate dehydrogenase